MRRWSPILKVRKDKSLKEIFLSCDVADQGFVRTGQPASATRFNHRLLSGSSSAKIRQVVVETTISLNVAREKIEQKSRQKQ